MYLNIKIWIHPFFCGNGKNDFTCPMHWNFVMKDEESAKRFILKVFQAVIIFLIHLVDLIIPICPCSPFLNATKNNKHFFLFAISIINSKGTISKACMLLFLIGIKISICHHAAQKQTFAIGCRRRCGCHIHFVKIFF